MLSIERLSQMINIPIQLCEKEKDDLYDITKYVNSNSHSGASAFILICEDEHSFGIVPVSADRAYIVGPVIIESAGITKRKSTVVKLDQIKAILSYISDSQDEIPIIWQESKDGIILEKDMEDFQIEKSDTGFMRDGVGYEQQLMQAIETGDLKLLEEVRDNSSAIAENNGLITENQKKYLEYMCVSSAALLTRAAIRGGLNPETAYDISDLFLKKLIQCNSVQQMQALGSNVQVEFTKAVAKAQKAKVLNIHVERCKDYIGKNLRNHFKQSDIAAELGISPSYLSRVFAESEKQTIQQYILKQRLYHASKLLIYTDYSIQKIAVYFDFSSQAHFAQAFKREYGISPREYRKRNKHIETI